MNDVGSLAWLRRTRGHLSMGDRVSIVVGALSALAEGLQLSRHSQNDKRRRLALIEPPETPMVQAARTHLESNCGTPMINHSFRTAFWTLVVLRQHIELTDRDIETAWVAALLHDVGLEHPPADGDFSLGGVEVLERLAASLHWSDEQTHLAGEAIAINLSTHVDPSRAGRIAWAMNVGGLGELGFPLHRAQMHPERIAELEIRYPRTDFTSSAMRLIRAESRRLPDGRFALIGPFFPWIMRD